MAKKSVSLQLSELRAHCTKVEQELTNWKMIAGDRHTLIEDLEARLRAAQVNQLTQKAEAIRGVTGTAISRPEKPAFQKPVPAAMQRQVESMGDRARRYCQVHGVKCVDREILLQWRG